MQVRVVPYQFQVLYIGFKVLPGFSSFRFTRLQLSLEQLQTCCSLKCSAFQLLTLHVTLKCNLWVLRRSVRQFFDLVTTKFRKNYRAVSFCYLQIYCYNKRTSFLNFSVIIFGSRESLALAVAIVRSS